MAAPARAEPGFAAPRRMPATRAMRKPKALPASSEDSTRVTMQVTGDNGDRWIGAEWGLLDCGRRARRDTAGNHKRNGNHYTGNFQPVNRWRHLHDQRGSRNGSARGGADWANVGIERSGVQINATMQLCRQEDAPEQQRQKKNTL